MLNQNKNTGIKHEQPRSYFIEQHFDNIRENEWPA